MMRITPMPPKIGSEPYVKYKPEVGQFVFLIFQVFAHQHFKSPFREDLSFISLVFHENFEITPQTTYEMSKKQFGWTQ